jgi:hypothetical protein
MHKRTVRVMLFVDIDESGGEIPDREVAEVIAELATGVSYIGRVAASLSTDGIVVHVAGEDNSFVTFGQ